MFHSLKNCILLLFLGMVTHTHTHTHTHRHTQSISSITFKVNIFIMIFYMDDLYGWASLVAQLGKNLPAMQKTWVQFLGREDPLEKEMATHSSNFAW